MRAVLQKIYSTINLAKPSILLKVFGWDVSELLALLENSCLFRVIGLNILDVRKIPYLYLARMYIIIVIFQVRTDSNVHY